MSNTLEEFREAFRLPEMTIHTTESWTWSVRPVHSTLGSGVLSLNRFCTSLGDITPDEGRDLSLMTHSLERVLRSLFGPQKMNYLMLMMVDRHLHFHVIPRYDHEMTFAGMQWIDSAWPKPPSLMDYQERASSPALIDIRDALRNAI